MKGEDNIIKIRMGDYRYDSEILEGRKGIGLKNQNQGALLLI